MLTLSNGRRIPVVVALLSGCLVGVSGLLEPVLSATESPASPDQGVPASTPESSSGSGKAGEGKGNHPLRKACAEDAKKFCQDVKAGEGRIIKCLKEHAQDLSPSCADMMQRRGKHRQ